MITVKNIVKKRYEINFLLFNIYLLNISIYFQSYSLLKKILLMIRHGHSTDLQKIMGFGFLTKVL